MKCWGGVVCWDAVKSWDVADCWRVEWSVVWCVSNWEVVSGGGY